MNNITAELVVLIAMFLSMLAFFMNLTKKVDHISKELSDFKDETRKEITSIRTDMADFKAEVRVELVRIQARFDKYDGVNTDLEKRVAEIQTQQQQIKEQVATNEKQAAATKEQVAEIKVQTATLKEQATASDNRVNAILQNAKLTL